ncbi:glycoside hydrolase [Boeremia exigua]|uniref:glycoside hydrolase n=1 Tax=Boeremia exigua TaxID=749465 RepID=UPI001E8E1A6C|nr:glycoside hydrolase [Boeremia exigua]KAH6638059.1 glycoside hydrolase [Boeremia exigua]
MPRSILAALSGALLANTILAAPTASSCTATSYSQVPAAVASCTAITLSNIAVPAGSQLDLTKVKPSTTVTFAGTTTFGFKAWESPLILIGGTDFHITAAPGAVIDGNGAAWWDGQGDNGVEKPGHFIQVKAAGTQSRIENLFIKNYPAHGFTLGGSYLVVKNVTLDNSAGDAPNSLSGGKPAAHNTDGFNVKATNVLLQDITVINQDDCVAVSGGAGNVTVRNASCDGSHGLSIGSVGSDTTIKDVFFYDSRVKNSQNGVRVKTVSGATNSVVQNILFQNITLSNINKFGIVVEQDYLNGGPTGTPTNGVKIQDVAFKSVTGTATSKAKNYYILCGSNSCSNITFSNVKVTGGSGDSCNFGKLC